MNWDFMSKMFYPKLGGNAVKWQVHKTQKPELNPSSLLGTSFMAQIVNNLPAMWETQV